MKRKTAEDVNLRASRSRASMKRVAGGKGQADAEPFVFISYARENAADAEALVGLLEAHAIPVLWDRQFEPGVPFDDEIEAALDTARAVIVLWSEAAIASRYVRDEAAAALALQKVIPVHVAGLDPARLPFRFRALQCCCVSDETRILSALAGWGLRPAGRRGAERRSTPPLPRAPQSG